MEIFDQQTNMLQANISSKYPVFTVGGLDSGKSLKIIIYAINVKGRSDSVLLEAFTLKAAEKQTRKSNFFFHRQPSGRSFFANRHFEGKNVAVQKIGNKSDDSLKMFDFHLKSLYSELFF